MSELSHEYMRVIILVSLFGSYYYSNRAKNSKCIFKMCMQIIIHMRMASRSFNHVSASNLYSCKIKFKT